MLSMYTPIAFRTPIIFKRITKWVIFNLSFLLEKTSELANLYYRGNLYSELKNYKHSDSSQAL